MAVCEASRHRPKIVYRHRQLEVSHEVVEETLLILQECQRDPLLELGDPVSRWMFSVPDLLQQILIRPSATGKMNFQFSLGNMTSFALIFRLDF